MPWCRLKHDRTITCLLTEKLRGLWEVRASDWYHTGSPKIRAGVGHPRLTTVHTVHLVTRVVRSEPRRFIKGDHIEKMS